MAIYTIFFTPPLTREDAHMQGILHDMVFWGYPLVSVVVIILAATRRSFPGKPWLIAYLAIGLASMFVRRLPGMLMMFDIYNFDMGYFYAVGELPLNIIGLVGFCLLIPFLFAVAKAPPYSLVEGAVAGDRYNAPATGDTTNPLYGVYGWLKVFVVVNIYISPVLFGIQQIMGFIGFGMLAEDYPGIVVVGLFEAAVGVFLVVKWIMIARRLRDIKPGVVQEVKKWLLITLVWNVLSTPLVFMVSMDVEDVMFGAIKQLVGGVIAFAIWYSYFKKSKRVKATYPDWD
jgi:hypothetical protein